MTAGFARLCHPNRSLEVPNRWYASSMYRRWGAALFAAIAMLHASGPPELPFLDWKACPFEGCAYRLWTAQEQVDVYDTWKEDRRRIALLSKGETVDGITGLVVTLRPGVIRIDRDLPEANLKNGDTILTYAYRGEGFSAVWFGDRYYDDFDISFTKWPDGSGCGGAHCAATYIDLGEKVWWAEVKLKSAGTGWVNMNAAKFDGISMLALLPCGPRAGGRDCSRQVN